jgi:hypothetical protein
MKRLAIAPLVLLLVGTGSAFAQYAPLNPNTGGYFGPSPLNRPALSPYLNLARPDTPAGINYYLGTIPEQQRRFNEAYLRNQVYQLQGQPLIPPVTAPEEPLAAPPGSGHATAFQYYSGYYAQVPRLANRAAPVPPPQAARPMGKPME